MADNAINLLAAENTASQHSTNSSSGSSIGIGYAFGGEQNGFTLEVAANKARGNADGDDLTYSNTHVSAGGTATLQSGGDATLKGAVVTGNTVVADIGGDLHIESLQDSSTYASKQTSAGFGLSLCIPPFCYGASSASVSASKAKVEGDFLSVTEQSGLKAGDGGYQIKVDGNTDLVGAVITSNQAAVDNNLNSLSTASLTYSDLVNKDVYDASGFAMSATVKGTYGDQSGASPEQKQAIKDAGKVTPGASAGVGSASGSQGSVTQSGISGGALTITDAAKQAQTGQDVAGIARDVTTENAANKAGALTQAWNGEELAKEVQAQVAITQAFSAQAPKAIASFATGQMNDLRAQADKAPEGSAEKAALEAEAAKWDEGGIYRTALHTISGALSGGIGGAVAAGTISKLADQMNDLQLQTSLALQNQGVSPEAAKVLAQGLAEALSLGIGATVGGTAGATSSLATDKNNRQSQIEDNLNAKRLAKLSGGKYTEKEIQEALRYAGLKDSQGNVLTPEGWNEIFYNNVNIKTGQAVADSMKFDPTMTLVVGDQSTLLEKSPTKPSNEMINYIVNNTGGQYSSYLFTLSATSSDGYIMPSDDGPRYFSCATTDCLLYGSNRNSANSINIAEDKNFNTKLSAGAIIISGPLAIEYGAPILVAMGTTAQTSPLVGGIAAITAKGWIKSVAIGIVIGGATDYAFNPDASPASMTVAGLAGAVGATTKLGLNASFGLANQCIPTTLSNIGTAAGAKLAGNSVKVGANQVGDTTSWTSWWTAPVSSCGPVPRKPC